ncbi:MAG: hypothetical protein ACI8RZ_002592 [Myxococcota bacterium]|jgi:hypothetical protein
MTLLLTLLGCTTPAPPATRGELILDAGWSTAPWIRPSGHQHLNITGTFDLGEAPGSGSVLLIEGGWWHLTATVNGTTLPTTNGGLTEARIPVGPHLRPGENTLTLSISAPTNVDSILTGGSLSSVRRDQGAALLQAPPRLLLRPEAHVDDAWLEVRDGLLISHAEVVGAPPGAIVRFSATLDGNVLADLGTAAVSQGRADAPGLPRDLPAWAMGSAALLHLHATLLDGDTRLDEAIVRTGVRELTAAPLALDGEPLRLMGARVINREPQTSLPDTLAQFAPAGINAAEIHGETFRRDWLDAADELGLPLVIVPRCIGRSSQHTGERADLLSVMARQDAATARLLRTHPAVVLLVIEGPDAQNMPLWTEALTEARIPIAGHDLPARVLSLKSGETIDTPTLRCQPKDCRGAWLVELTPWWRTVQEGDKPDSPTRWRLLSEALVTYMTDEGAIGAIVPSPNPREAAGWESAWQSAAAALSIPAVPGTGRGRSEVMVTGAHPGETVWLSADHAPTTAAIADATGTARLSMWHSGPATVQVGDHSQPVTLRPGRWRHYSWQPEVAEVTLQR